MKRLRLCVSALAMVGMLFSAASCVDDDESATVTQIRSAKAKLLEAEAAYKKAEADAKTQMVAAEVAKAKADAEAAQANADDLKAQLAKNTEIYKLELEEAIAKQEAALLKAKQEYNQTVVDLINQKTAAAAQLAGEINTYTGYLNDIQTWKTENAGYAINIAEKELRLATFSDNYEETKAAYLLDKTNTIAANEKTIEDLTAKVAEYKTLRDGDVVAKIQAAEKDKAAKEAVKVVKERAETEAQAALNAINVIIAAHPNKTKGQLDADLLAAQTDLAEAKGDLAVQEKMLADTLAAYTRLNTAHENALKAYNAAQDKIDELTGKGQTSGTAWDAATANLTTATTNLSNAATALGSYQALYNAQVITVRNAAVAVENAQSNVDGVEKAISEFNTVCEGKDLAYWIGQRAAAQTVLEKASTEVSLAATAYNVASTKLTQLETLQVYVEADEASKDATDFFADAVNDLIKADELSIANLKKANEEAQRDIDNVMVNAGSGNGETGIQNIIASYNKDIADLKGLVAANEAKIEATQTLANTVKAVIEAGLDAIEGLDVGAN